MKATGIVRRIDELGRIVLPIELRKTLGFKDRESLEIYVDADKIILKKYVPACAFCGSAEGLKDFKGMNICGGCRTEIGKD